MSELYCENSKRSYFYFWVAQSLIQLDFGTRTQVCTLNAHPTIFFLIHNYPSNDFTMYELDSTYSKHI